jgi:hypothetical protein
MPMAAPTPASDSTRMRMPGSRRAPAQPARPEVASARLPAWARDTGEATIPSVPATASPPVASTPAAGWYRVASAPASSGPITNSSSSRTASSA